MGCLKKMLCPGWYSSVQTTKSQKDNLLQIGICHEIDSYILHPLSPMGSTCELRCVTLDSIVIVWKYWPFEEFEIEHC